MTEAKLSARADQAVRAAVEVLGEKGAAGLTHRAVDRHAGLPEGSTSNHFRTRGALLEAIGRHLTAHDLAALDQLSDQLAGGDRLTPDAAAKGLAAIIDRWTGQEDVLTAARLELFLIAHRDPAIAAVLAEVRRTFRARTRDWLEGLAPGAGDNAALVMALVEGLTANQLLHKDGRMTQAEIETSLRSVLAGLTD